MLFLLMGVLAGKGVAGVNLDGHTVNHTDSVQATVAGIRINVDGTIDERFGETGQLVYSQIDAATDWIIPNVSATTDYEFRVTNAVWAEGTVFNEEAAAEDTWKDLTTGALEWNVRDADSGVGSGTVDVTFDLQVRKGAGAVLATGSYRLIADYGV